MSRQRIARLSCGAALIVLVIIGIVFFMRGQDNVHTVTTTPNIICAASASTESQSQEYKDALQYMCSPERVTRYEQIYDAASIKVAHGLLDGRFGPVEKYNELKTPLVSGYSGWGGIQTTGTTNQRYAAWVWWNADGTVDFSKGVKSISVQGLVIHSDDDGLGPFRGSIPRNGYVDALDIASIGMDKDISQTSEFHAPTTVRDLKELDNEALTLLSAKLKAAGLS